MSRIPHVLRVLLGLGFTAFALNYFVPFLPPPAEPPPPPALQFLGGFVAAKYMTLVKLVELTAGLLLLTNRFVPLALALLAPILVGILHFHVVLAPAGIVVPLGLTALEIALAWCYRDAFAPMLRSRAAAKPLVPSRQARPLTPARA